MTTLDDLARVERELRDGCSATVNNPRLLWLYPAGLRAADTIAAYVKAQRERQNGGLLISVEDGGLTSLYVDHAEVQRLNRAFEEDAPSSTQEPTP